MILFRCDANEIIGAGHLMRCLSIASAAKEHEINSCFVLAEDSFASVIEEYGFKYKILETDYADMESERNKFASILEQYMPEYIIVDSYYVTSDYLKWLKDYGKLIYIDDRAEFAYPADMLVNYNIFAPKMNYFEIYKQAKMALPTLLLGAEYIPLRKEFQNLTVRSQTKQVKKVFISTGGADAEHVMLSLLRFLQINAELRNRFELHFVVGVMNGDRDQICQVSRDMPEVILHQNVKSMSALMRECDMAISAAGSTLYELCACGIPTITYILADNQIPAERVFVDKQIMVSAGDYRRSDKFPERIFRLLEELSENYNLRDKMAANAYAAVNANGADRFIQKIKIALR